MSYSWDDTGQGPPLVFLHGLFLDRTVWQPAVKALSPERRCLAFDMPGHGPSTWRAGLDLDGIAADIALWIAEHGAAGATPVGHSQGGMVALRNAMLRPDLIGRLVLANTSARAEYRDRPPAWRECRTALLGNDAARAALSASIKELKTISESLEMIPEKVAAERAMME